MAKDSKNTDAYLLGQINANVEALLKNQAIVIKDIDDLKKAQAWLKGIAFAIGSIAGLLGGFVKGLFTTT
jgi:hypothetical protein